MEMKEVLDQVTGLINAQAELHKKALDDLKKQGIQPPSEIVERIEKMSSDVASMTNAYTDFQAKHGDLQKKNDELAARLAEAEARLNRKGAPSGNDSKIIDPGKCVVDAAQVKEFIAARKHEMRGQIVKVEIPGFSVKDIVTETQGTSLINTERRPGIQLLPDMPLTVRALIPTTPTTSNAVEFVKESTQTNNAGPQYSPNSSPAKYDGALKNKSDLTYTLASTPIRTIAHYMKASRQILDDVPQLQGQINNRLLYFLALEEEEEILRGDGTAGSLLGIIPQASAYNAAYNVAGDTKIDKLRHALLQVTVSKYMPTNIVLHPEDWHDIELTKTGEGASANTGAYLLTNPVAAAPTRLWGLPVLPSLNMTNGDFLVGNFRLGATIFDRMTADVMIATQNEDDFIRNMVTILAEERIGLAVYRADAFVEGTF